MNEGETRLYVDAEITVARGKVAAVFGLFSSREMAELALIEIAGRKNCQGAIIRDPNA